MPLAAAGIGAAGSILGGITGGKGAQAAAKAQAQAQQAAIGEQRNEFNTIQANNQPYTQAGTSSLASMLNLLGLGAGGATGQQGAIDALKASPTFTALDQTGTDAILQNAAATGGLRGGNTQNSLYNNRSNLLASVIQQQLGNLGALVNVGQAGASGTNAAASNTGNAVSSILTQGGNTAASGILGGANSFQNTLNSLSQIAGKYFNPQSTLQLPSQLKASGFGDTAQTGIW
ncbi:hypothetical protein [Sphingomonas sp. PWP1-2]|uniref:hypothetical protein n=1 Tax=Sphingomonas sp. PWP1-2 TaxID=2804558 RepID=UPI003CE85FE5